MNTDAVVTNYRTPDDLIRFVNSWVDHGAGSRLTIVNVAPTSEDTRVATSLSDHTGARVMEFEDNIGYGRACNAGAQRDEDDRLGTLAFFNADVELTSGAMAACHEALWSNVHWGVLGPRQVDDRGRLVHAGILGTGKSPAHRGWQALDRGQYTDVLDDVPTVSGSAYWIKRRVWDQLTSCPLYRRNVEEATCGAFLPTSHYYEETWCSYHARAHGWRCVYFGTTTLVHQWHKASSVGGWAEKQMPRSRETFREVCEAHSIECD